MWLFSGPNKFLVETALDVGIDNLQKTRGTDPKKLYEEVRAAIWTEPDEGMKKLYEQYIKLYEVSIARTMKDTTSLKDSLNPLNWKDIGDLKKAVKNGIAWLTEKDIQALNQFALAEYARQNSNNAQGPDSQILDVLGKWFRIYEGRTVVGNTPASPTNARESITYPDQKTALIKALKEITSENLPYTFSYTENGVNQSVVLKIEWESFYVWARRFRVALPSNMKNAKLTIEKDDITITGKIGNTKVIERIEKTKLLENIDKILALPEGGAIDLALPSLGVARVTSNGEIAPNNTPIATTNQPITIPGETRRTDGLPEPQRYPEMPFSMNIAIPPFVEELLGISAKDIAPAPPNRAPDATTENVRFWKGSEGKDTRGYLYFSREKMLYQWDVKNNQMNGKWVITTESMHYIGSVKDGVISWPGTLVDKAGWKVYVWTFEKWALILGEVYNLSGKLLERLGGTSTTPADGGNVPPVATPESVPETLSWSMKALKESMDNFRKVYKAVSDKTGTIYDTPEEIKNRAAAISEALIPFTKALARVEAYKLTKEEKQIYDSAVLEVAKYFNNDIPNVRNRHYRNYDLAFDMALSLIKDDLKKQNIKFPERPGKDEILKSLKDIDPKLQKKIQTDIKAGYDLGQILSNPQVRSQWESVYEKIYKKYEDEMESLLTNLKKNRPTTASGEGQVALDLMISIMGTKDFWDWKARNKALWIQTAGMVGSTVAGVWAMVLAAPTLGSSAIVGWALLSGVVTTIGMVVTKGRWWFDSETALEFGLNTASLGAWWFLAKGTNAIRSIGTNLARAWWISIDAVGWVALGMGVEHARAYEAETSITLPESFKNNWYWAIVPIALGMKGALRARAEAVQKDMNSARDLALSWDKKWAEALIKGTEPKMEEVAKDVKAVVGKAQWTTENANITGEPLAPNPMSKATQPEWAQGAPKANSETPAVTKTESAAQTPHTNESAVPKSAALSWVDKANLTKSLERKFDALQKDGDSISVGHYTVTKDGKNYRVKQEGEGWGEWIKNKKNAFAMVESWLADSLEHTQATIRSAVQEWVQAFPKWKSKDYTWNGEKYTMKKSVKWDDVEVVWGDGKILSGKELESFYADQAWSILNTKVKSFLQAHGDKPLGEAVHGKWWYEFTSFEKWRKWHQERSNLNPIKYPAQFARYSAEQIWDSLKAPIKSIDALRQWVMKDQWLWWNGKINSTAKAIVLRDANKDWISTSSAITVAWRWVLMTGALAIPLDAIMWEGNLPAHFVHLFGLGNPAGDRHQGTSEYQIGAVSTYYWGLIWWNIITRMAGIVPTQPVAVPMPKVQ